MILKGLKNIFKSSKKEKTQPIEPKEFVLSMHEANCVGDWYKYTVKAESKEEAFKKLVEYFFGTKRVSSEEVESDSGTVHYKGLDRFKYDGMPYWFARRISGDPNPTYQRELEDYAKRNNIILKS
jgi:hypothetical protein